MWRGAFGFARQADGDGHVVSYHGVFIVTMVDWVLICTFFHKTSNCPSTMNRH